MPDDTRAHVIGVYRDRARRYDTTAKLYYVLAYPHRTYRRRAIRALRLRPGNTVVDIGCGTGLNFSLIEQIIGPTGRIVGVDLTDAMLSQAERRIRASGWSNVSLVQADAVEFEFPTGVDAILSTYALSLVPECAEVIAHGAAALPPGGRWAVLDTKAPDRAPGWLAQGWLDAVRPFAVTEELLAIRSWEALRAEMEDRLTDLSWNELFFGFAYLAAGTRR